MASKFNFLNDNLAFQVAIFKMTRFALKNTDTFQVIQRSKPPVSWNKHSLMIFSLDSVNNCFYFFVRSISLECDFFTELLCCHQRICSSRKSVQIVRSLPDWWLIERPRTYSTRIENSSELLTDGAFRILSNSLLTKNK